MLRVPAQSRPALASGLPARAVAARALAPPPPLAAACSAPARGLASGAPARDELERSEAVTSELQHYGQWLADTLPTMIDSVSVAKGELCLVVPPPAITQVMTFLRDHTNCQVRATTRSFAPPPRPVVLNPPHNHHHHHAHTRPPACGAPVA